MPTTNFLEVFSIDRNNYVVAFTNIVKKAGTYPKIPVQASIAPAVTLFSRINPEDSPSNPEGILLG
jgi:hypothetical protein